MNEFVARLPGQKVLIFGLGRQGGGAGDAKFLTAHGAQIKISDRDLTLSPEGQTREQIDWADLIIKNPGVPDDHSLLTYAREQNKPVLTSIAIFVKYTSIPVIGITGTRGKSTTTALITHLLNLQFPGQIVAGGNIPGTSGLSLFDLEAGHKYAVLELSSFQLHNFHELKVSPPIAIITNLYPDHLNRYPDMASYQRDKEAICAYQTSSDMCIYNANNDGAVNIAKTSRGQRLGFHASNVTDWATQLPGDHNRENIAAMWELGKHLHLSESVCRQAVASFPGLPSRLQVVRTVRGVTYINDTTATAPTAAIKALQSARTPTIWITGGDTKNLPFDSLLAEVATNTSLKQIIILGSRHIPDYTQALHTLAHDKILGTVASMSEAVKLASQVASAGDSVLLSPGFASFDLFLNEFDRGDQFNKAVSAL